MFEGGAQRRPSMFVQLILVHDVGPKVKRDPQVFPTGVERWDQAGPREKVAGVQGLLEDERGNDKIETGM